MLNQLKSDLQKLTNPKKAEILQRFFKTGRVEYGEGDVFLGLTSRQIKEIAKKYYQQIKLPGIQSLLKSKIHEERLAAVRILVAQFNKNGDKQRKQIFDFYLKNTKNINNWDLVDLSAPNIVGNFLLDKNRKILYQLARSKNLWEKRIAIIATYEFIKNNQYQDTLRISKILLKDKHDLIHKAVGWMLREMGKRNQKELIKFLDKYLFHLPRTALRYAIEKFPEKKRKYYLNQ